MIKRKLKKLGILLLILLVLMFIWENGQEWTVKIPFATDFQMPAYAMLVLLLALGYLAGFLTMVWVNKRKQRVPVGPPTTLQ